MAFVEPLAREQLHDLEPIFALVEGSMGFVPRSMMTMARWPELMQAFSGLAATVTVTGDLEPALKQLIAFVASNAAGCRYCQAHTSHVAERYGVSAEKIAAAFEFEKSPLFSARERAALRVALHAGLSPNAVEPEHMAELSAHFSDRQVVEIVAVIALFGFLNRWNDTMATALEDLPKARASAQLAAHGWEAGKHDRRG